MGWKTEDDSVRVVSKESVEDRDPKLYIKRAEEFVKKGMYAEAEKEYDKAIEFSGKKRTFYVEKQRFYVTIGEEQKARQLLIRILITKDLFLVFFAISLIMAWMEDFFLLFFNKAIYEEIRIQFGVWSSVILGINIVKRLVYMCKTKWSKHTKIKWHEHIKHGAILLAVCILHSYLDRVNVVNDLLAIIFIFFYLIYGFITFIALVLDVYAGLSAKRKRMEEVSFEADFASFESDIKANPQSNFSDNFQYPEKEQQRTEKALQQEDVQSRQETFQREPSFMSADEGMLLVLDVPIQKGKILLNKVIVTKDIVKLPINGKNIQIDVSCKKVETIQDIDYEHCKRYDIKKGSLVYVLVAMVEYCINIWSKEWDDNTESACGKLTVQLNQKLNPYGIKTRISKRGWQFLENNVLVTFEDTIYLLNSKRV